MRTVLIVVLTDVECTNHYVMCVNGLIVSTEPFLSNSPILSLMLTGLTNHTQVLPVISVGHKEMITQIGLTN